MKLSDWT